MKRLKYPSEALAGLWKKNYMRDTSKFAKSTFLENSDYMREFKDEQGEAWRILGAIEGKEMPCEKISTGEVFIWDKWNVSLLVRPEEHNRTSKTIVLTFPEKKKGRKKVVEAVEEVEKVEEVFALEEEAPQADFFRDSEIAEEVAVGEPNFESEDDEE